VTGLLMLGDWVLAPAPAPWFQWLAFALAGVVQLYCGAQFYSGAWRQLKVGQSNMDTLVALGSSTAFGYSTWALLAGTGGHVYFMEAAAIISLISFGHWLEARVNDQAGSALKALLHLAPQTARKLPSLRPKPAAAKNFSLTGSGSRDFRLPSLAPAKSPSAVQSPATTPLNPMAFAAPPEAEIEVPVASLTTNDRVVLRPGDRVPVDGVVLEGESSVDEAMLTGEAICLPAPLI
jgi:Cu+-exporting ATPase